LYIFNFKMKDSTKFIKKLIIFLVLIGILLLIINHLYVITILERQRLPRNQQQFIEYKSNNDLKIIILGDSLASFAINPAYLNNSFNLATPAENLEQTYYKTKWLIENEPGIEVYVLQYNYHAFNYYRIKPYYFTTYWKSFMTYEELGNVKGVSKQVIFFEVLIPVIGKGEEILKYVKDRKDLMNPERKRWLTTKIENGWINDDTVFPENIENTTHIGQMRAYNQFRNYPIVREEEYTEIFLDTLKLLKENNKTVVLIQYPLTDEYLIALERDISLEEISEEFKDVNEIIEEFDYKTLNYLELLRYNQTLFVDSDHLNYNGSRIFTEKINENINL